MYTKNIANVESIARKMKQREIMITDTANNSSLSKSQFPF